MEELKNITQLVKLVLDQDEKARNSDSYLYFRILGILGERKGIDINHTPVTLFLLKMKEWGFPPFESVRRARQKIQAEFPELAGNAKVSAMRAEREKEFREFARGSV